jgi:hypothetical protein
MKVVALELSRTDVYCAATFTNLGARVHVRDACSGIHAIIVPMKKNGFCTQIMLRGFD